MIRPLPVNLDRKMIERRFVLHCYMNSYRRKYHA